MVGSQINFACKHCCGPGSILRPWENEKSVCTVSRNSATGICRYTLNFKNVNFFLQISILQYLLDLFFVLWLSCRIRRIWPDPTKRSRSGRIRNTVKEVDNVCDRLWRTYRWLECPLAELPGRPVQPAAAAAPPLSPLPGRSHLLHTQKTHQVTVGNIKTMPVNSFTRDQCCGSKYI